MASPRLKPKLMWVEPDATVMWSSAKALLDFYRQAYYERFEVMPVAVNEFSRVLEASGSGMPVVIAGPVPEPHVVQLLNELPCTSVIYHQLGAFLSRYEVFAQNEAILKKHRLRFVAGSTSSVQVLRKILRDPACVIDWPFGYVSSDESNSHSSVSRSSKGSREPIRVAFVGRISWFKNVHHLVDLFSAFATSGVSQREFELQIFGPVDNLNWRSEPAGFYMNHAGEVFAESLRRSSRVIYHGVRERADLQKLLPTFDAVVSLSTCEEEDFGLGLREALEAGCRVIATDWGGHRDLRGHPRVRLVPIDVREGSLFLDHGKFVSALKELERPRANEDRRSPAFSSLRAGGHSLDFAFEPGEMFGGFSRAFKKIVGEHWQQKGEFYERGEGVLSPLWR